MKEDLKGIIKGAGKVIKSESKVVIFGHVNPDGDAIGSTLGLKHFLSKKVSEVTVIVPNDFPDFLKWMPDSDKIILFDKEPDRAKELIAEADILFFCDFNDPKRVNGVGDHIDSGKNVKIMIDHHPQPVDFVDYLISDTSVSSTSELVYEFIENQDENIPENVDIATCLLTGIVTDTGLFSHNSETIRTFEIVSKLLKMGADKKFVINKLYNEYPYHRMQLLGNTLHNRMQFFPEFGTSYIYLSKEDQEKYNYQNGDSEGFVNMALSIAGARFAAIFIEKEEHVKASFRSIGNFDVNQFARKYFHGGGHKNAAGGKSFESLNKTLESFVKLAEEHKDLILE